MAILKFISITSLIVTLSYAKIDFVKFGDICDTKLSKSCQNKTIEIKAIQYLLKKKIDKTLALSGKLDSKTKSAIIKLQRAENIPANGYIGKKTKDALNKLLYGHRLHSNVAKKDNKKGIKVAVNSVQKNRAVFKKVKNSVLKTAKVTKKVSVKPAKTIKKVAKITTKSIKKDNKKVAKISSKKILKANKILVKKDIKVVAKKVIPKTHRDFVKLVDLRKSYAIYKDPKLLRVASPRNSLLKVNIREQRIKLLVNGKVAIDSPCTTGAKHKLEPNTKTYRDKHTPTGVFRIMEKIADKRSTIFGNIYRNGKLIYHGDRRKYRGSWKGVKFVGASLKRWMRLTSSGIGLHASNHIKRYPGSNGCIRIPPKVATLIFKKVTKGTKVRVTN